MAAKYLKGSLKENMSRIRKFFMDGVNAVQPHELIKNYVKREGNTLMVNNNKLNLNQNVYIVGFGKAVIGMVRPLEILLKSSSSLSHLKKGIVSVPYGIRSTFASRPDLLPSDDSVVEVMEGAKDNIPDEDAFCASQKITSLVKKLQEDDLLIVLISGGGSALLPYPLPPLTLEEKQNIVKSLSRAGATITELNTVRKALSATKGGKLANMTNAQIISLILSDVVNSPLDVIASGPTVANQDPAGAALSVLEKYNTPIPEYTRISLKATTSNVVNDHIPHVANIIIGSNETALSAVTLSISQASEGQDHSLILSSSLQGEASVIGGKIAEFAATITRVICGSCNIKLIEPLLEGLCDDLTKKNYAMGTLEKVCKDKSPVWLIFGGETTVHVTGSGRGGRNQEMVLSASIALEKAMQGSCFNGEILFLSGGTDGIDGPTDAAGAVTYWQSSVSGVRSQVQEAYEQGINPENYLKGNDSYAYFSILSDGQYLLKPGHTGTNVMDLQILAILPSS